MTHVLPITYYLLPITSYLLLDLNELTEHCRGS